MILIYLSLLICYYHAFVEQLKPTCTEHQDCQNGPDYICRFGFPFGRCEARACSIDSSCPIEYFHPCVPFFCNNVTKACDIHHCTQFGFVCNGTTFRCDPPRLGGTQAPPSIDNNGREIWQTVVIIVFIGIVFILILGACWFTTHGKKKK